MLGRGALDRVVMYYGCVGGGSRSIGGGGGEVLEGVSLLDGAGIDGEGTAASAWDATRRRRNLVLVLAHGAGLVVCDI